MRNLQTTSVAPVAKDMPLAGKIPVVSPLARVKDLNVQFRSRDATVHAVNGVSFDLMPRDVLCIIGESGSGKSVTMKSMMRLLPPKKTVMTGEIEVNGHKVLDLSERQIRHLRGAEISMIFQEPMTALDPVYTIGRQITEAIRAHEPVTTSEARRRALELLELVRIPSAVSRLDAYPHELSGGLRQRAMIAVALSCKPKLLLADEPTTALDATVQIQVLVLLRQLQDELGMGVIFVTHDIGVAAQIADKIAVMYAGEIVEFGSARDVLVNPAHPYTRAMLASTVHGQARDADLPVIPGDPADLRRLVAGCRFAPRCGVSKSLCLERAPSLVGVAAHHDAACHLINSLT
ncbi:peptide/nickel transport system ATP-binding protein [Xaviernesmea oryzae]|uniref:Peptide/nickel transport system ATP-binding protein n=2 Tax=Xaviernesmea oryzae TaxID=464029 RepID=A0A1X7DWX3_9HYPH|nr:peptide/nickel transport system ATP-binding protein [Xaviernesmea oryzae]